MDRVALLVLVGLAGTVGASDDPPPREDAPVTAPAAPSIPNIIIIFADDLGYADVGAFGARGFATPHLDRMASEGMRFTDFYVAQPVCSASRAALLTGCYPNRVGIAGALGPGARHGIAPGETTLAELCRSVGHDTAIFGKWHLGSRSPFLPIDHGFDRFVGILYSNDMWPLHPDQVDLPADAAARKRGYPDLPLLENDRVVDAEITPGDQARFTRRFTDEAVAFIDAHPRRPFFLYLAHPMPHVPLYPGATFQGTAPSGRYGDVIQEIDWSVGQILEAVARNRIDQRTLVIFTSDNGPWLSYGDHGGSAGPLREGKGTTFEGGVRVPCLMRWPGTIPAGSICREPVMTIDVFPTVATIIGGALPEHPIDGRDITPLLRGDPGATTPHQALFFYYNQNELEAVRSDRWKLHFPHRYRSMENQPLGQGGKPGPYDWNRRTGLELYDLQTDIGESIDVAADHPEVVQRIKALADAMRAELGDRLTGAKPTAARPAGRIEGGS